LEENNLQEQRKRLNHPLIAYVLGVLIMTITLVVLVGIIDHLTISPYGPGLLMSLKKKIQKERESLILTEVKRLEEMVKHKHFHITVNYPKIPEKDRPVCYICHSDFPHKKNKKIRALMNMHTQYFVCETCHIEAKPGTEIVYKWYSPFEDNPKGPFFGTYYDPRTEMLVLGNKYAKIAPYFKKIVPAGSSESSVKADNLKVAIQKQDAPLAIDFMKVRDELTPEQRDSVKNRFHENIKSKGHECKTCHSKDSIFDFKELGFSEQRISDLTTLEIVGIITKYGDFYLPDFFKDEGTTPQ
jgi:hypothetical protein